MHLDQQHADHKAGMKVIAQHQVILSVGKQGVQHSNGICFV